MGHGSKSDRDIDRTFDEKMAQTVCEDIVRPCNEYNFLLEDMVQPENSIFICLFCSKLVLVLKLKYETSSLLFHQCISYVVNSCLTVAKVHRLDTAV